MADLCGEISRRGAPARCLSRSGLRYVGHGHRGREAIAPPVYRRNEPGRLCRIAQGSAQFADGDAYHRIADSSLGPDGVEQRVLDTRRSG